MQPTSDGLWQLDLHLPAGLYEFEAVAYSQGTCSVSREAQGMTRELQVPAHPSSLLVECEWGDPGAIKVQHMPRASLAGSRPTGTPRPTRLASAASGGGGGGYGLPGGQRPHASLATSGSAGGASSGAHDSSGRPVTPRPLRPGTPAGSWHHNGGSPAPCRSLSPSLARGHHHTGAAATPVATRATSGASAPSPRPLPARTPSPAYGGAYGCGGGRSILSTPSGTGLRGPAAVREGATRLLVTGIPTSARVDEVVRLLSPFGMVEAASLVRDRHTGKPKGMALVVMESAAARDAIAALHHLQVGDSTLTVVEQNSGAGLYSASWVPEGSGGAFSSAALEHRRSMAPVRAPTPRPSRTLAPSRAPLPTRTPAPMRTPVPDRGISAY